MENKIYEILGEIRPEFDFKESDDFIEDGFLDSFDVVTVITELENEFGVIIDGLEVIPENFTSVDSIKQLVERSSKRK